MSAERVVGRVLVVDDEPAARQALGELLRGVGHEVRLAADGYKALGELEDFDADVVLTDIRMPLMDGLTLIGEIKGRSDEIECVVMTAFGSIESAVEAMRHGADDYLTKPLHMEAVEVTLERAIERRAMVRELRSLREGAARQSEGPALIGSSAPMRRTVSFIERIAPSSATVLITGESGTGKEIAASMVHARSERTARPFVPVHCAALPESLLDAELFGYVKGAFTGAIRDYAGQLGRADHGTLFLDEIGEIAPPVQVKLLRFLQTGEIQRIGAEKTSSVDARVIAATNRDLAEEVREGRFREDLYYRLNVIHIEMPALRDRPSDVAELAHFFALRLAARNGKPLRALTPELIAALEAYHWPGNARELENVIERAIVLLTGDELTAELLPPSFGIDPIGRPAPDRGGPPIPGSTLAVLERHALLATYRWCGGDTKRTAEVLGVSQRKVQYRLREYAAEEPP